MMEPSSYQDLIDNDPLLDGETSSKIMTKAKGTLIKVLKRDTMKVEISIDLIQNVAMSKEIEELKKEISEPKHPMERLEKKIELLDKKWKK